MHLAALGHPLVGDKLYHPDEARLAGGSGYRGRTGIYELVTIDDELRTMIHDGAGEADLLAQARQHSAALAEDGWAKVCAGVTSAEEVLRVSRERN